MPKIWSRLRSALQWTPNRSVSTSSSTAGSDASGLSLRAPQETFEQHLKQVNLSGARLSYLLAAILVPATSVLDWVSVPDHAWEFFVLRICVSVIALLGFSLTHVEAITRHPITLGAGSPLLCALSIEIMILRSDGPGSPYYAGLNLCILAVAVLYTWRWYQSLAVSGLIVLLWLIPAIPPLVAGELSEQAFFNNLIFLVNTAAIAVASAVIRYRGAEREHRARTELGTLSDELTGALERLQEHDRLKNEFFANISHELRTPLTLILSPVEDLLARDLPRRTERTLATVRRNAQRLLRLIDDLLDLARLDARGLRLSVTKLNLTTLTTRVVDGMRPAAEAANIDLTYDLPTQSLVYMDPHRIEIILTNLLGNALKFTPAGGRVSVTLSAATDGVRLTVADTGPGIAEPDLERIFDRFYQAEGTERRVRGGAGIGLPLARSLAELHGGGLTVESRRGNGAAFTLFLRHGSRHFKGEAIERRRVRADQHPGRRVEDRPLSEPPPSTVGAGSQVPRPQAENIRFDRGRKPYLLVAEDETDLREFIVDTLGGEFDIRCAVDGEEAMVLVRQDRPDLVLTDLMMPKLSGTELCRQIKCDPLLRATPVILLTARSGADATLEGYAAGADDFVGKPFHPRVLQARVRAQLKLRSLSLQLAAQSRLASASALAAGIAHEVKNPLNAIVNAARALPKLPADSAAAVRLLSAVENGAQRIASIVGALEDHVRPADGSGANISDLDEGVKSTLRLLEYKLSGIEVDYRGETGCHVVGSARELNQVLLNLLDNAIKAGPSRIWVDVEIRGDEVVTRVSDDGPGVPRELESLLFEPFFTTRQDGQGTGLGLYLSRRMISDCGGELSYRARPGGGAQFTIQLPVARRSKPILDQSLPLGAAHDP